MKTMYCESLTKRWTSCERYKLSSQGIMPPITLLPNGKHLGRDNTISTEGEPE